MEDNIENEEGILIQGKENYCSKFKKGKLKTKKLLNLSKTHMEQSNFFKKSKAMALLLRVLILCPCSRFCFGRKDFSENPVNLDVGM